MKNPKTENRKSKMFLGVDGGQSHTEAVVADAEGNILGRGNGGASNHAEQPGGRERLKKAVIKSVGEALRIPNSKFQIPDAGFQIPDLFASAHFGMTGGADYKKEIIGEIIRAEHLKVGHDAPSALFGATAGKPGIVVIDSGIYAIQYSVSGVEPGQFALFVNGAAAGGTIYGSGAGTQQNSGRAILVLSANDVLTLVNHTSAAAVTLQTLAGGTQTNVNASLLIEKLA